LTILLGVAVGDHKQIDVGVLAPLAASARPEQPDGVELDLLT
jgi:hypothetical protein